MEHERVGAELGCGVDGGPEQEEDGVQEVVPLSLFLRHHLHHSFLQQRSRTVVQRVELKLLQRRNLLKQVPLVSQQPRYLQTTPDLSTSSRSDALASTPRLTSSQKSRFWAQTTVLGAPNLDTSSSSVQKTNWSVRRITGQHSTSDVQWIVLHL